MSQANRMGLDPKKYPDVFRTFLTKYLDTRPGADLGLDEKQRNTSRFKSDNAKVRSYVDHTYLAVFPVGSEQHNLGRRVGKHQGESERGRDRLGRNSGTIHQSERHGSGLQIA